MKITLINRLRTILIIGAWLSIGVACDKHEDIVTPGEGDLLSFENSNTFLQVLTPVVSFQAGEDSYDVSFNAIIGHNEISKVNVYSTFTDAASATGLTAEEVLIESFDVTASTGEREVMTTTLTYDDLKKDVLIDGDPLPASDFDLAVGAGWEFRFVGVGTDGMEYDLAGTVAVAVLSPYAGLYKVVESAYYRIGVLSGASPWNGVERFIGSVDDDTFVHEWIGPLHTISRGVDPWTFDVDLATFVISAPSPTDIPLLGDYSVNCVDNPGSFTNVSCAGSNVLIPDLVMGKHKIKLTFGYVIDSDPDPDNNGVREFYEVLEKVVN